MNKSPERGPKMDEAAELKRQLEGWGRAFALGIVGANLRPNARWIQGQQISMLVAGLDRDPGATADAQAEIESLTKRFGKV